MEIITQAPEKEGEWSEILELEKVILGKVGERLGKEKMVSWLSDKKEGLTHSQQLRQFVKRAVEKDRSPHEIIEQGLNEIFHLN